MKIEKLKTNKIKVTFSCEDMMLRGLTAELVAKNSPAARELFYEVLRRAEAETGFTASEGRIMVEAMRGPDESLVMYITRLDGDFPLPHTVSVPRKRVRVKAKSAAAETCLVFDSFDDVVAFANALRTLEGGTLYSYKKRYYLTLRGEADAAFLEFAHVDRTRYIASRLEEHGKKIADDALDTIRKYFS